MSEEIKEENKCNCDKKELKRFLLTILGSFLGCLVALCLYSAATKPQIPPMPPVCPIQRFEHQGFNPHEFRGHRPHIDQKIKNGHFGENTRWQPPKEIK